MVRRLQNYHRYKKDKRKHLREFYANVITYNSNLDGDHGDPETHFMTILPSYWIARATGEILISRGIDVIDDDPAMVMANTKVHDMNDRLHSLSS